MHTGFIVGILLGTSHSIGKHLLYLYINKRGLRFTYSEFERDLLMNSYKYAIRLVPSRSVARLVLITLLLAPYLLLCGIVYLVYSLCCTLIKCFKRVRRG